MTCPFPFVSILLNSAVSSTVATGSGVTTGAGVITGAEYDDLDEYEAVTLTFYDDGVLTDDKNNVITDREHTVGDDFQNHFGEFEDDSVFIRDEERGVDYEILEETRKYSKAFPKVTIS